MSPEEKVYIKDNLLKMVQNGTNSILKEPNHIKDQLAKIIVELIKVFLNISSLTFFYVL